MMAISLPYLAEVLFAAMVNRRRDEFFALSELDRFADLDFVRAAPEIASREVPLARFAGKAFDGASRIDVVVRLRPGVATAFELKLGTTRLSKSRVDEEWLACCVPSHNDRRWKGNMMAILERRFSRPVDAELAVDLNGERLVLTPMWFVVARRATLSAWETACPAFSENVRRLAFEQVVESFGGREPFNTLVAETLAIDFYREWVLGDDAVG
jgi:hypothetical protein